MKIINQKNRRRKQEKNLSDPGFTNYKISINCTSLKLKKMNFCSPKDTIMKMKRKATDWERVLEKRVSDKEF